MHGCRSAVALLLLGGASGQEVAKSRAMSRFERSKALQAKHLMMLELIRTPT